MNNARVFIVLNSEIIIVKTIYICLTVIWGYEEFLYVDILCIVLVSDSETRRKSEQFEVGASKCAQTAFLVI